MKSYNPNKTERKWQKYWEDKKLYLTKAREKGLVRTEGKEYIVQDGDVIEFRI